MLENFFHRKVKKLTPADRLDFWERFYKRVNELFSEVEDELNSKFQPYCFDEKGELVKADKDTPDVKKLFDMLADLDVYLQGKFKSADDEHSKWTDEQANLYDCFNAWSLGLCPEEIRKVSNSYFRANGGMSIDAWACISKLRTEKCINREDTRQAIAIWTAEKLKEHAMILKVS